MNALPSNFIKTNNLTIHDVPELLPSLKGMSRMAKIKLITRSLYSSWLSKQRNKEFHKPRYRFYWENAVCEVDHEGDAPVYMTDQEIRFIGSDCAMHLEDVA